MLSCIASILVIGASALTWYGTWDCRFFGTIDQFGNTVRGQNYGLLLIQGTGLDLGATIQSVTTGNDQVVRSSGVCVTYHNLNWQEISNDFDAFMWAASVFGVISLLVSLGMTGMSLCPCWLGPGGIRNLAFSSVFMAVFAGLEFLSLSSHLCAGAVKCQIGFAGKFAAGAVAAWVLLIPVLFFISDAARKSDMP